MANTATKTKGKTTTPTEEKTLSVYSRVVEVKTNTNANLVKGLAKVTNLASQGKEITMDLVETEDEDLIVFYFNTTNKELAKKFKFKLSE